MATTALFAQIQQWQQQAATLHIRLPVVWQGDSAEILSTTQQWISELNNTIYWIGEQAPANAIQLSKKHNYQLLGSECEFLVINAFSGFDADLIAASAGCIKAGGIWLLLCPPFANWQQQANPAHKSLLPFPLDASSHQGHFLHFFCSQLQQQNVLMLEHHTVTQQLNWPDAAQPMQAVGPCITADQQTAVAAIQHVISGHRRRPLVLTADRGRGKSAALGIAAATLAQQQKCILLTAPSPQAAQTALNHFAQLTSPALQQQLRFVPFDQLLNGEDKADLLLVDEAAAIPTPVLQKLAQRFSRIAFASTEHGYEGTGRGFQLRFQQHLETHYPGWKKLHLQQPIRYQAADPLEQLIFNCFLLKQNSTLPTFSAEQSLSFAVYQATNWLHDPVKLQQVFSLLSLAHYQTQVKDLASLLDNPQLQVMTLEQKGQVLACAMISTEGNIAGDLAQQIYFGERRVQGHLLAQSLAFHLARPELAELTLWRVMRIAVQPTLQRQQLGSQLLQFVAAQAQQRKVNFLGTSFGVNQELLRFWQQNDFIAVRLGHSSDKASAEHSILMVRGVISDIQQLRTMQQQFRRALYFSLQHYPQLDTALVLALVCPPANNTLSPSELEQLHLFAAGKRPYELISHLLLSWFNLHYNQLTRALQLQLAALLWQRHDWQQLLQQFGFYSSKAMLANIAEQLLQSGLLLPNS
ncbi:tRNA(Met) cytidine acetyltransferase TmcA [Rheinheimera maricola]|uniref:tRNA(Met) cytidine acetyltransferase TmcA n=1 Tax=Rheinheimera maricola TaxID=2793282 RepID=A0ABS7XFI5_9GAMM|nr:GNAT family N-acetyltransferase [Rheinheimera maricola]MBZ9613815.1 GNAT family N-acetyltransferase [Rheinheimera maricola]